MMVGLALAKIGWGQPGDLSIKVMGNRTKADCVHRLYCGVGWGVDEGCSIGLALRLSKTQINKIHIRHIQNIMYL